MKFQYYHLLSPGVSAPGLKIYGARRVSTEPRTGLLPAQLNELYHKPDDRDD